MPFGKAVAWQAPVRVTNHFATNAAILTSPDVPAFIADQDYEVVSVAEVHETAGDDAGAVSLDIRKVTGTSAISAGTSILASTFNMKSTAKTVVRKEVANGGLLTTVAGKAARRLAKGDRLSLDFGGVTATLTGVCVTTVLLPTRKQPSW